MKADLTISTDRLTAMLATAEERDKKAAGAIRSPVPKFYFSTKPAVLVLLDGEPKLADAGGGISVVLNCDQVMLTRPGSNGWYLWCAGRWFTASSYKAPGRTVLMYRGLYWKRQKNMVWMMRR
jgi:hypothetical protein